MLDVKTATNTVSFFVVVLKICLCGMLGPPHASRWQKVL